MEKSSSTFLTRKPGKREVVELSLQWSVQRAKLRVSSRTEVSPGHVNVEDDKLVTVRANDRAVVRDGDGEGAFVRVVVHAQFTASIFAWVESIGLFWTDWDYSQREHVATGADEVDYLTMGEPFDNDSIPKKKFDRKPDETQKFSEVQQGLQTGNRREFSLCTSKCCETHWWTETYTSRMRSPFLTPAFSAAPPSRTADTCCIGP